MKDLLHKMRDKIGLDNVKIGNLKKKNRDQKVPKQDEDAGNMQILLHLRSYFDYICYYTICYISSHYQLF